MMTTHSSITEALKKARATIAALDLSGDRGAQLAELDGLIAGLTQSNPDDQGFFWWLIAIGIGAAEVADGIDFTDRRAHGMVGQRFSMAPTGQLRAKVIGRPSNEAVAKAQGFPSVAAYLKDRGDQPT